MFVDGIVEPGLKQKRKNKEFSFEDFLEFCKKQDKIVIDKEKTKQGNTKIRYNNKIVFYAHSGKKTSVILWNNLSKKNCRISTEAEAKKLIATISK